MVHDSRTNVFYTFSRSTQDSFQGLDVAARLANRHQGCLAELSSLLAGFLLATGFGLGAAAGCDASEDLVAVVGGEVDERDGHGFAGVLLLLLLLL